MSSKKASEQKIKQENKSQKKSPKKVVSQPKMSEINTKLSI